MTQMVAAFITNTLHATSYHNLVSIYLCTFFSAETHWILVLRKHLPMLNQSGCMLALLQVLEENYAIHLHTDIIFHMTVSTLRICATDPLMQLC